MDQDRRRQRRVTQAIWSIVLVVILVGFIILVKVVSSNGSSTDTGSGDTLASASLISKLSTLPDSIFATIGQGTATPLPKPIKAPALTKDGKPLITYIGAEYCPYCATERWPMVIALLRFGTFSNLGQTHSSSQDAFPNTQTFSFHGATYTSQYLAFEGVEEETNQRTATGYATLDTPTSAQQNLITTYDAAPYVAASSAGAIPFIDFGGLYLISGSTYDPSVLQGKTVDQIADALKDPTSPISKGAVGAANTITAAICSMTGNQPGSVCNTPTIQDLITKLNAGS